MGLLFINALKGLRKKKIQMFAIVTMIMLSTCIYVGMNTSLDRLEDRYYEYLNEQKVEYFSFSPVIDYQKDINPIEIDEIFDKYFLNIDETEKQLLNTYKTCYPQICNSSIYENIKSLFEKYDANEYIVQKKLSSITDKYNISYNIERSKIIKEDNVTTKALPYSPDKQINIPYLIKGSFPQQNDEVAILPNYAKKNNLNINDNIIINEVTYKIVGLAYASDHIYPLINLNLPIYEEKNNNIVFLTEEAYTNFKGINDDNYVARFNYDISYKDRIASQFVETNDEKINIQKIFDNEKDIISMNTNTILKIVRTDALQMEFDTSRTFADTFLYLLLGISIFIILIITKKRIDDEKLQIGVLKSLGYSSLEIATSYLVYPILGSIIGGLLGYVIGISINPILTNAYLSYFTVPLDGFYIDMKYLLVSILMPLIVLSIMSYLIAFILLRKKPLYLLKDGSNLKVNRFSRLVTKVTSPLSFNQRFKYSLASRSFGKLAIISLTSFCTGMLIILTLIGINLFNTLIDKTYEGLTFDYMVTYNYPQYDSSIEDDLILETKTSIVSLQDSMANVKKIEEKLSANLVGIDTVNHYQKILNDKGEDITLLLTEGVIVTRNISENLNISVGDNITVLVNQEEQNYKIVGISEEYIGTSIYIKRSKLSEIIGIPLSYTKKYSKNPQYDSAKNLTESEISAIASILNLDDLKGNIERQMQMANTSIYVIIAFSSFMALVIIAVIANIVVEENKRTISIMKVMGYRNKEISNIVLNIYTPFVILFYLLSIPAMISLLKAVVNSIVGDINMVIPITLSPIMAIIGLIGLLVGYFLAIIISKKVLNKVPLSVALKRE